jgi:hypothetical protein
LVPTVELKDLRPLNKDLFHTVEDMIDFSLTEIEQPLNMIPKTPAGNYSETDDFESGEERSNSYCSASKSKDMEVNNDSNEERGNQPHIIIHGFLEML